MVRGVGAVVLVQNHTNRKQFLKTRREGERGSRAFHTCENRHRQRGNSAGLERGMWGKRGKGESITPLARFPRLAPVRLCRGVC